MKNALLTNPAFRYVFEIFVIIFSVTISFYIQDILNKKDKEKLKNNTLQGFSLSSDHHNLDLRPHQVIEKNVLGEMQQA